MQKFCCSICDIEDDNKDFFREYIRALGEPPVYFCPVCWNNWELQSQQQGFLMTMAIIAFGFLAVIFLPAGEEVYLIRFSMWLLLCEFLGTIIHEFGHAFMAKLMGSKIYRISFGYGKVLYEKKWKDLYWEFRNFPLCGFVQFRFTSKRWQRLRHILIVFAGPATNIILAGIGWYAIWQWPLPKITLAEVTFWHALAFTNSVIVIFNLFPLSYQLQSNDGMAILQMLFTSSDSLEKQRHNTKIAELTDIALEYINKGEKQHALQVFEDREESVELKQAYMEILLHCSEYRKARCEILQLLENCEEDFKPPLLAVLVKCNLSIGEEDLILEAEKIIEELTQKIHHPQLQMLKGLAYAKRGRQVEAIRIWQNVQAICPIKEILVECACYIALVKYQQKQIKQSKKYLTMAKNIDKNFPMIKQIKTLMHQTT